MILPLVKETVGQIGAARQAGQEWAAKPLIAILEETFRRMDDPADVEKFLPVPPPPMPMAVDPLTGQPIPVPPADGAMGAPAVDPSILAGVAPGAPM